MENEWYDIRKLLDSKPIYKILIGGKFNGRTYATLMLNKKRALKEHLDLVFMGKDGVERIEYKDLKKMSDDELLKYYNEKRKKYDNN